jgi:RNA polymerase sigma-70 factor (ECF subfamily)
LQVFDWQIIIKKHGLIVWQTAYRLLGNQADSADCFQETFLGAVEISRRQSIRNMRALLVRLATMRAIDQLRQRFRQSQHNAKQAGFMQVSSSDSDPVQRSQAQELVEKLLEAVSQLPSQEAKAFCLRYLSDMSYRQIADELNVNTNAAGVLLHRAKAKLKEALAPQSIDNDRVIS